MRVLRRAKARREPLSDAVRHYLRTGENARRGVFGTWFDAFQLSGEVMRRVTQGDAPPDEWVAWGDEITREHIAEQPGTRPHGWWCFAAPGPRECAGAAIAPSPLALWRLHRGTPFDWPGLEVGTVLHLESEAHYLRRHRLLEPGERQRIALAAFEPDAIVITDDEDTESHHDEEE